MSYKLLSTLIGAALLAAIAVAAIAYGFQPPNAEDQLTPVQMAAPIICLLIMWTITAWIERRRPLSVFSRGERSLYVSSLIAGAGILVVSLGLNLLQGFDILSGDISERIWGAATGGVLMILGNLIPKTLPPLTEFKHAYRPVLSCMGFAGTGLFLSGLGFALAWLALPIEYANRGAMFWCLTVFCIVLIRTVATVFNVAAIERSEKRSS
jgi:hypothetical protein